MDVVLGLVALAAFGYFLYKKLSKPNATGTSSGGGVKPDDSVNPSKK